MAVWTQERLTIRGMGQRPLIIASGAHAEGKGTWVIRGQDFRIENLEFRGARVPDGNGAGIRLERGRLHVVDCAFVDNQTGILTSNADDSELEVHRSVFADAPRQEGSLPHLIYVGRIRKFSVSGSRFENGYRGHLIKSRALHSDIRYNWIVDGPQGRASYEIDLPNGGVAVIVGNVVGQSAHTENPAMIAYGAEGAVPAANGLHLAHNTFLDGRLRGGRYLRIWQHSFPFPPPVVAINNLTVGWGSLAHGIAGVFRGNHSAVPAQLDPDSPSGLALRRDSHLWRLGVPPGPSPDYGGRDLTPQAEFDRPIGTRAISPRTTWSPGAFQSNPLPPR